MQNPLDSLAILLLDWYRGNARVLPWRENSDPYRVWVSEIMLQQTRVAAVLGYYARFMDALPTLAALAAVPEDELLKLWQGLGYYSRARNLKKAAQQIMEQHDGHFPREYESLKKLAGIGEYTAAAIASIAFSQPRAAVDGNLLRIVARLCADYREVTSPAMKKAVTQDLNEIIPKHAAGDFNQAMMDLGATVCLPNGAPLCHLCPLTDSCLAYARGETTALPVRAAKKARRIEARDVFFIFHADKVALRRRPDTGLLAKLWEFPNELAQEKAPSVPFALANSAAPQLAGTARHIFTHIEWHLCGFVLFAREEALPSGYIWASRQELEERYALPSAFSGLTDIWEQHLPKR